MIKILQNILMNESGFRAAAGEGRKAWGVVILCACVGLSGCANRGGILGVDCCSDIPAGAVPEPVGTKVCNLQESQISAANQDQNVLYKADFVGKTTELAPNALDRLARQNATASLGVETTMIEPSGDPELDKERLKAVGNKLAEYGVSNVSVEIAVPAALGLSGPVAESSLLGGNRSQGVNTARGGFRFGGTNAYGGSY